MRKSYKCSVELAIANQIASVIIGFNPGMKQEINRIDLLHECKTTLNPQPLLPKLGEGEAISKSLSHPWERDLG
ncbi:hypothetical protein [Nostoc sp.]|uniref:hypothetical protein n=1 Tax=Nostoc sp. TaxID=1180 RepID=UPI002FF66934